MRAGLALLGTLLVGFGGIVGLQMATSGPGGILGDADTTEDSPTDGDGQPTTTGEDATDEALQEGNGTDVEDDPPANLTLAGPDRLAVDEEATFHGRLTVDGEPVAGDVIELHVDGEATVQAETDAGGAYEARLVFDAEGEHRVQATAANASLTVDSPRLDVTVTVAQAPITGAWSMLRGDPARTGAQDTAGPGDGSLVWELDTELDVRTEPAVAGDRVFVGTGGHADCCRPTFLAVNASTGEVVWNTTREHGFGSPVVHEGRVVVGSGSDLLALDAGNGSQLWSRTVDLAPGPAPAIEGDAVYTVEDPGEETSLVARSLDTGEQRWSRALGGEPETSPAVVDGTVYVGLGSTLYALDAGTGATEWTFEAQALLVSAPAVADGIVHTASLAGEGTGEVVYAVDAGSGEKLWTNTLHGRPGDALAVAGGQVYVASTAGWLYSFDAETGDYGLNESLEGGVLGGPSVTGGTVYLAPRTGTVVALDALNGAQRWSFPVAGHSMEEIRGSPVVVDGRLFVGIDDDCTGCSDTGLIALDAGASTSEGEP